MITDRLFCLLIIPLIYDKEFSFDQLTTIVERYWVRFELSLDSKEQFVGFSYKLNAVLIIVGLLFFIWLNSLFQKISHTTRLVGAGGKSGRLLDKLI